MQGGKFLLKLSSPAADCVACSIPYKINMLSIGMLVTSVKISADVKIPPLVPVLIDRSHQGYCAGADLLAIMVEC